MINSKVSLWLRRIASVISVLYCGAVCRIAYFSLYYDINVRNRLLLCVAVSCVSLLMIFVMLFSRKQILTKISALVMIPAMLPVVLFYYGSWEIIVPVAITAICVFFLSGMTENTKTVIGTIYLLLYIIGALAYFLVCTLFSSSVQKETVKTEISQTGKYRYEEVITSDSSNGSTSICVEPNDEDYDYNLVEFKVNGLERNVFIQRPVVDDIKAEWKIEKREDIIEELLDISGEIKLSLDSQQKALIGYDKDDEVKLSDLSEDNLDALGIEEEGDVLYINDEPYFRYLVAEIEQYFNPSEKEITLFQ